MWHKTGIGLRASAWFVLACLWGGATATSGRADDEGLTKVRQRLASGEPTTIVCLGDSVTGTYYHTGGRRAYTDMLGLAIQQVHPAAKLTMVNAGISGNTTRNGLDRFDADVLAKKPHLVTIMFGLNDMVRTPIADFRKNLRELIDRARQGGAEVLLCTPNGVIDSSGRPVTKLIEYCEAIRETAREAHVPTADCYAAYEAFKARDPRGWRLLLSDAIHPNMDGHKLLATEIGRTITGKAANLDDVGPPADPLRHSRAKLARDKKLKIVAMTPYDEALKQAVGKIAPDAAVEVVAWPATGKTLTEIVEFGRQVRSLKPDLVWVATPAAATAQAGAPDGDGAIGGYSAILNASLSFGLQEWDVVASSPNVTRAATDDAERRQHEFARRLVRAQDLTLVERPAGDERTAEAIVIEWLTRALAEPAR